MRRDVRLPVDYHFRDELDKCYHKWKLKFPKDKITKLDITKILGHNLNKKVSELRGRRLLSKDLKDLTARDIWG